MGRASTLRRRSSSGLRVKSHIGLRSLKGTTNSETGHRPRRPEEDSEVCPEGCARSVNRTRSDRSCQRARLARGLQTRTLPRRQTLRLCLLSFPSMRQQLRIRIVSMVPPSRSRRPRPRAQAGSLLCRLRRRSMHRRSQPHSEDRTRRRPSVPRLQGATRTDHFRLRCPRRQLRASPTIM